jgi:hypothetical protein
MSLLVFSILINLKGLGHEMNIISCRPLTLNQYFMYIRKSFFNLISCLLEQKNNIKFVLASLKHYCNPKFCSENSVLLCYSTGSIFPVYKSYPASGTIFNITSGFLYACSGSNCVCGAAYTESTDF